MPPGGTPRAPGPADAPLALDAGGHRLECRWYGPRAPGKPESPVLVFLHEGLGCVSLWRDFPDRAAATTGLPAFAYSRAGYGGSDPVTLPRPVEYMHHEAAIVLPALLDAAGIEHAVLVGHSDGGSIALLHAGSEAGARAHALLLMAPHAFNEPITVASIRAAGEAFDRGNLRERLRRHHGDNVDVAFRGWHDVWVSAPFSRWNITHCLPAVRAPVALLQGEDDEYGSAAQVAAITAGVSGHCESELLARCSHAPWRDRPRATLRALARLCAKLGDD